MTGAVKDRPILFSAPMVRALLDGSKTQTRRVIKLPPVPNALGTWEVSTIGGQNGGFDAAGHEVPLQPVIWHTRTGKTIGCPHGQVGERLWVRETWAPHPDFPRSVGRTVYRADPECEHDVARWYPSIHMRREYSRILLEIVSVRVELLNDCSAADALAEGIQADEVRQFTVFGMSSEDRADVRRRAAVAPFERLWESINGAGSWAANPWVWVIEFKRVAPALREVEAA